jgi:peptidyl-prolyl cis-trans isomerase SurA
MKYFLLAIGLLAATAEASAQTLFTYGKKSVDKEEFLRAFNKNPNATQERKAALQEYLDLYVNFKLKVAAALDAKVDQMATQKDELQNFRKQIEDNYVNEEANADALVAEAFVRSQKDIHAAQLFVQIGTGVDSTMAFKRINEAYAKLKAGGAWAASVSEFATEKNDDLGWITLFTLGYDLENTIYNTKPGSYSAPVRTKWGWHIFKNVEERAAVGKVKIAQILFAKPQNASADDIAAIHRKADSIYAVLKAGAKFGALAREVSNDRSSFSNEGVLPEFGVGQYDATFENAAFALKAENEISKPIETVNGFHILKLMEKKLVSADRNDALYMANLKQLVTNDKRMEKSRMNLIAKKLQLVGYKPTTIDRKLLYEYTDSFVQNKTKNHLVMLRDSLTLHSFSKQKVLVIDWCRFVRAMKASSARYSEMAYDDIMKEYVNITAGEYYKAHLEEYSPGFRAQIQEFKEANLLFEIMDRNVWSKAAVDSAGLAKHYAANKTKYMWGPSADAIIVTCANQTLADEVKGKMEKSLGSWKSISESYGQQVLADSNRFELGQIPTVDKPSFKENMFTPAVPNNQDGTVTFSYIVRVYKEAAQRGFDDARGFVISDYQTVLEQKWIAELKKKYPVKINQALFKTL